MAAEVTLQRLRRTVVPVHVATPLFSVFGGKRCIVAYSGSATPISCSPMSYPCVANNRQESVSTQRHQDGSHTHQTHPSEELKAQLLTRRGLQLHHLLIAGTDVQRQRLRLQLAACFIQRLRSVSNLWRNAAPV